MKLFLLMLLMSLSSYAFQIRTSPLLPIINGASLEIGENINENILLSVGGYFFNFNDFNSPSKEYLARELHLRIDYYYNNVYERGFYTGLTLSKLKFEMTKTIYNLFGDDEVLRAKRDKFGYLLDCGYRWQHEYLFIELGLTYFSYGFDSEIKVENATGERMESMPPWFDGIDINFQIGWKF